MEIYVIQPGDTLYAAAARFDLSPGLLAGLNGLRSDARLAVGQTLIVRPPRTVHTVQAGESVCSVARQYGLTPRALWRNNVWLGGRSNLRPGDELIVSFADNPRLGTACASSYAYPSVEPALLDAALPFLGSFAPFTYGLSVDGGLLPLADESLLTAARYYGAAPLMHLSTLTEEGGFSNERSSILLNRTDLQNRLIQDVIDTMREKGYAGLDVDFEFVYPGERVRYAAWIDTLRRRLNPLGWPVLVALAPKNRAGQPGLLYEAHDYALLGEAADAVLVMTYEWGYTYGPPMAVSPLPQVRAVLDYAVSVIDPRKILLGVPLYGYDWLLPYRRGETRADSISPVYAVELAKRYQTDILYDTESQSPYFYYTSPAGQAHAVWFEDARSMDAKLRLIAEYGLLGAGFWNLMRAMPQAWTLLHALYDVSCPWKSEM